MSDEILKYQIFYNRLTYSVYVFIVLVVLILWGNMVWTDFFEIKKEAAAKQAYLDQQSRK